MPYRVLVSVVAATVVLASGCSSNKPTLPSHPSTTKSSPAQASASPSAEQTAPPAEAAPGADQGPATKLDGDACVAVTGANLDLATATNHDAARKAADTFEKYDLPSDVKDAVEHFVDTNGAQFDDPDYDKYNKLIDDWVKQSCPLG
jgi:hypothetical protein